MKAPRTKKTGGILSSLHGIDSRSFVIPMLPANSTIPMRMGVEGSMLPAALNISSGVSGMSGAKRK